ncbi:MAG TPA: hypothetical protein VHW09_30810 [Bryobacteraceae bacterium]|jgi:uncharacterized protein involved in exopolysaccharide biosynthesis|nr:hypothetical protein [Bryobacteraceae bacterium]
MAQSEYRTAPERLTYLLSRWRVLLLTVLAAGALACGISECLPPRYTAVSTVIIDPPGTNDPRASMVVNPTYLDSLRTFERFFTSDTLFAEAIRKFHLNVGRDDVDILRKRILKVGVEHDTRVLQVSATLPNPKDAIALVQFITRQSLAASRDEAEATDRDTLRNVTDEFDRAQARLQKAESDWQSVIAQGTPEALDHEVSAAVGLQYQVRQLGAQSAAQSAEFHARAEGSDPADRRSYSLYADAAAASASEYAKRQVQLDEELARERKRLAELTQKNGLASGELDAARKAFEAALARKRDFSALNGLRSEHMRVIDPGVEPTRQSSPDVLLNTVGAALLAGCLSLAWLAFLAGSPRRKPSLVHPPSASYEDRSLSTR